VHGIVPSGTSSDSPVMRDGQGRHAPGSDQGSSAMQHDEIALLFVGTLGQGGGVQDIHFVIEQHDTLARVQDQASVRGAKGMDRLAGVRAQDQAVGFVDSLRGENEPAK